MNDSSHDINTDAENNGQSTKNRNPRILQGLPIEIAHGYGSLYEPDISRNGRIFIQSIVEKDNANNNIKLKKQDNPCILNNIFKPKDIDFSGDILKANLLIAYNSDFGNAETTILHGDVTQLPELLNSQRGTRGIRTGTLFGLYSISIIFDNVFITDENGETQINFNDVYKPFSKLRG